MSLKNYIFSSINTKGCVDSDKFASIRLKPKMTSPSEESGSAAASRSQVAPADQTATVTTSNGANGAKHPSKQKTKFEWKNLLKLSYISVEPIMLCWILPSCFLFIAVENLSLEKVYERIDSIVVGCFFSFKPIILLIFLFDLHFTTVVSRKFRLQGRSVRQYD